MTSVPSARPLPPEPSRSLPVPPPPLRDRAQSPSPSSFSHHRRASSAGAGGGRTTPTASRLEPVLEGGGGGGGDHRLLVYQQQQQQQQQAQQHQGSGEQMRRRGSSPGLGKQRSRYFEQAFGGTSRDVAEQEEKVRAHAMVLAELKTNVLIQDEGAFITDLAAFLSKRYHRPTTSITITLQHGTCLFLAGSFKPAYSLALHALPSQVQPVTNKRNLLLVQAHLEAALRIPAGRGLVRFVAVPEECLGCGGKTVAGVLGELQERAASGGDGESLEARIHRRKTMRTFSRLKPDPSSTGPPITIPAGPRPESSLSNSHPHSHSHSQGTTQPQLPSSHGPVPDHQQHHHQAQAESPSKGKNDGNQPQRSVSLRHKKSLNFLQSFFHKSTPSRGS